MKARNIFKTRYLRKYWSYHNRFYQIFCNALEFQKWKLNVNIDSGKIKNRAFSKKTAIFKNFYNIPLIKSPKRRK